MISIYLDSVAALYGVLFQISITHTQKNGKETDNIETFVMACKTIHGKFMVYEERSSTTDYIKNGQK